mmetsp:Transcript_3688/g.11498  ORF Transcript_3688/g.11498 Transcript_3688/m.11498 type:complete len:209 (+) Transcript_3688:944-1570(+)
MLLRARGLRALALPHHSRQLLPGAVRADGLLLRQQDEPPHHPHGPYCQRAGGRSHRQGLRVGPVPVRGGWPRLHGRQPRQEGRQGGGQRQGQGGGQRQGRCVQVRKGRQGHARQGQVQEGRERCGGRRGGRGRHPAHAVRPAQGPAGQGVPQPRWAAAARVFCRMDHVLHRDVPSELLGVLAPLRGADQPAQHHLQGAAALGRGDHGD